ncbi:hypothetical protein QYE76_050904 [Lolium multiflorum]|uniref:Uncharacterized protein n=1 Tax=Lolium multiflorum TaxID=4521 RepID=A0AAD8SS78_LOLMU|nr:hypothetical protein QYE76_050904 [Lolium multiflorum]
MMVTIKTLLADKEVSSEKRDERKRREKEDAVKNYYEIQTKKLEIEEIIARAATKEMDNTQKELEMKIMATPAPDDRWRWPCGTYYSCVLDFIWVIIAAYSYTIH